MLEFKQIEILYRCDESVLFVLLSATFRLSTRSVEHSSRSRLICLKQIIVIDFYFKFVLCIKNMGRVKQQDNLILRL